LAGLLSRYRRNHSGQTGKNGKPAHERYQHGPVARPEIVSTDDCETRNKEQCAIEVDMSGK
jgi:hypothetical protein